MIRKTIFIVSVCILMVQSSCNVLIEQPRDYLPDGQYKSDAYGEHIRYVYAESDDEGVTLYPLTDSDQGLILDRRTRLVRLPDETESSAEFPGIRLVQPSFDLDLLTFAIKYRPGQSSFPEQLNSDINGALYAGYRRDIFDIGYLPAAPGKYSLHTNHFGYSFGVFSGVGATYVTPFVTGNHIDIEYDGVVWSNGLAALIAVNQITLGLGVGWDYLFDENRKHWIYQNKPWVGVAIGINLN